MASILSAGTTNSTALNLTADTSGSLILASNNNVTAVTVDTGQNATFANTATFTGSVNAPNTFGFKNRIINGAINIDQRNSGANTIPTSTQYTVDRFCAVCSQTSKMAFQQDSSANTVAGFTSSLKVTSLTSYTVGAAEQFLIRHNIEGVNIFDLAWGSASAKTVTLSFWVRSSLTGTFGGALYNNAGDRSYPFSYTISTANTWEQKTITIPGDQSGTWLTTNGVGITVAWGLGVGSTYSGTAGAWAGTYYTSATSSTSVVGTSGATFYITGVQLETGTKATSFDYRPYGTELQLCQRYYENSFEVGTAVANGQNATAVLIYSLNGSADRSQGIFFKVQKRALCTFNFYSPNISGQTAGQWMVYAGSWSNGSSTTVSDNGYQYFHIQTTFAATQNYTYLTSGNWTASAEL
jgi:hypothetical protein